MPTNVSMTIGNELGAIPAALGTLLDVRRSASDSSPSPDSLREAVQEMVYAINNLLNEELDSAQACLQRAASTLRLAPRASEFGGVPLKKSVQVIRGGLAPWQARLLKTHIETQLEATIRTKELAELVQLSSFHFCRAFRVSFGAPPHGYVTRRRIERAQGLILTTKLSLGQIAADCGFADQAHFSKLFRRFTGESPGQWRRMRSIIDAEKDPARAAAADARSPAMASNAPGDRHRNSPPRSFGPCVGSLDDQGVTRLSHSGRHDPRGTKGTL